MNYHQQEEVLFDRWAARARQLHDSEDITRDGLLYRGELWFDGYCQVHRPGDEEKHWNSAPLRLLVVTKELYDEDGWDLRGESGRVPSPHLDNSKTAYRFFPNMELWAYGLLNTPGRKAIPFDKANRQPTLQKHYETAPIARINCKKQPEAHAISNNVLSRYLRDYADLLREQVLLYGANIILCLGGQGLLVKFLKEHCYADLQQVNDHCYYASQAGVAVVKQYHPCYNVYSQKEMYTRMMKDYQQLLTRVPQFGIG